MEDVPRPCYRTLECVDDPAGQEPVESTLAVEKKAEIALATQK